MHQESERHNTKQSKSTTQSKAKGTTTSQETSKKEGEATRQHQGILIRRTAKVDEIDIPPSFRNLLYQELHEKMDHLGAERV